MSKLGDRRALARRLFDRNHVDRRALVCAVVALLALASGLALVLSHGAMRRSGTNGVFSQAEMAVPAGHTVCQTGELLPARTAVVRIQAFTGAAPLVVVRSGGRVLDRAEASLDVRHRLIEAPLAPAAHDVAGAEVCLVARADMVLPRGPTPPLLGSVQVDGKPVAGSAVPIDYLLAGERSWWAFAPTVAARMGRGHGGIDGSWTSWAIAALMLASLVLSGCLVARTLIADVPTSRVAVAVAVVAMLHAAAWSFVSPPFQIPDEAAHVAYVQALAESGRPQAHPPALKISPEQATAMADTRFGAADARTYAASAWSRYEQRRLEQDLARHPSRRQTVDAEEAEPQPPLYYALETIPYAVAGGGTLLDRIALMRLLSTLLAGATALLSYLFVRECLPGKPWAWTVGGLAVALLPMFGFISGGVNPDGLLLMFAAALFLCVARAWHRGVTSRLALGVGLLLGAAMLTKVNAYGLLPGTLVAFALAARRSTGAWNGRVALLVGGAAAAAVALFAAGAAWDGLVWHRSLTAARPRAPESHVSLWSHFGYVWQVFLPRLPFQPQTALQEPGYQQLFQGFVGAFGQLVVWFPRSVYRVAALGFALVVALAVRELATVERRELRWRAPEIAGYVAMAVPLLLLIGLSADLRRQLIAVVQGRYLLPLLPLFALLLAVGARGAGERWGRSVGVAIVSTVVALSLFGQLVTIAFFYT